MSERWATFDCYGTLIDWEGGIRDAFAELWPEADRDRLLRLHHAVEPRVEEHGALSYREVLARCLTAVAAIEGLEVPKGQENALADSLPRWPPFPEVRAALAELRERGWRLAILSNTDPDLLDSSVQRIGVPFDLLLTAREAGSYKPAPGHWERFFASTGCERERHVHVAASLFHDIEPCARMGLAAVWINRMDQASEVPRAGELTDLGALAQALDDLSTASRRPP
jgi:2-haloacid dehalogenase